MRDAADGRFVDMVAPPVVEPNAGPLRSQPGFRVDVGASSEATLNTAALEQHALPFGSLAPRADSRPQRLCTGSTGSRMCEP
ncbi:hypothetical protein KEM55_007461 [Ascosphaera atra]|nr:hypothetical protein KEM55_007461 [Ascosphaera atra]